MSERVYCSELAQAAGAQLAGTAVEVHLWLLIEYARPWRAKALEVNELDPVISQHLAALSEQALLQGVRLRTQFIKQGASDHRPRPLIYLCEGRDQPRQLRGELNAYKDLLKLSVDDLLAFNLPARMQPVVNDESMLLVCTNGQRDLCCARFGLPLFENLRMEFGARAWQTTHIGGHRYAPNLVCLPTGLVYGFVNPETAVDFIHQHDNGSLPLANLRGRACYSPPLQAAEYFLRSALPAGQQYQPLTLTDEGEGWVGYTLSSGGRGRLAVAQQELPPVLASCGAEPKPDYEFKLHTIQMENG
ncbi:MAG: sucrase ferredoxin [Pseudomonadales bacterium]